MPRTTSRLTIDRAGRIVLPKTVRAQLQIEPGDEFSIETTGEEIVLRPIRETQGLSMEQGVWVFRTGQPLTAATTDATLHGVRQARDMSNLGAEE